VRKKTLGEVTLAITVDDFRVIEAAIQGLRDEISHLENRDNQQFDEYCRTGKVADWETAREELGLEEGEVFNVKA